MALRRSSMVTLLLILPLGYLAICVLLYFRQDAMVFFPSHAPADELEKGARQEGFVPWENAKGERIGWQSIDGDAGEALLVFHGNGGFALHRSYLRPLLRSQHSQSKIYLLEYPGYGAREGSPSEKGFVEAGREALAEIAGPGRKVWILGESLGSGVASAVAAREPDKVAGLVLVTPFDSLVGAARIHYPWLPVGLFMRTRFDSVSNLAKYPGPVAFLVAERDSVVPAKLGERLYSGYKGIKRLWLVPQADHNDSEVILADWKSVAAWLRNPS